MIAPLYQYYFLFLSDCRFQSIRITVSKGGSLSKLPDALFQEGSGKEGNVEFTHYCSLRDGFQR
jgi:transcriptional regulator